MTKVGDRIKLIRCSDPWTDIRPGTEGVVTYIDALGTVHVKWDDGHSLGMVEEAGDRFIHVVSKEAT